MKLHEPAIDQTGGMSDWWLDERGHAGDEHLNPDYVAGYERKSGFDPADDIDVLRRHGLATNSVVVDMGAGPGVFTVVDAGFLSYHHDTEPADFLFTRNALHQVPDFWKAIALQRFASILRPGGVLRLRDLVFDFEPGDAEASIEAWLSGAVTDPTIGFTAEELATHVRTEFSTYSWLFEPMIERAGFTILDRQYRRSAYAAYTCKRRATRETREVASHRS